MGISEALQKGSDEVVSQCVAQGHAPVSGVKARGSLSLWHPYKMVPSKDSPSRSSPHFLLSSCELSGFLSLSWVYVFVCMYVCAHVRVCTCTCVSTRLCKALIPLAAGPSLVTIMSHHVCKDQTTKTLCQPCGQYLCHPCTICKWETFWEYFGGERHSYNLIIYFPGVCWKRWLKDLLQV